MSLSPAPIAPFDCHMHTPLCGHATGEPAAYVEAARARGLERITFTCHMPMSDPGFGQESIRMGRGDLPRYRELVAETRTFGQSVGVEVLYGIEAEIFPDPAVQAEMQEIIEAESFDFVLGSLHHMLPIWREWMARRNLENDAEKVRAYFENLAEGAATGLYHSIAHPDVIRVYGSLAGPFQPAEHAAVIREALQRIAESGTSLEINTSGLIKGEFVAHPDPLILDWSLEHGVTFTLGSDAHLPRRVGDAFDTVLEGFRGQGLRELRYFRGGHPVTVPI